MQDLAARYQFKEFCRFEHEVICAKYDEDGCYWHIDIKDQAPLQAQFLILLRGLYMFRKSRIFKALKHSKEKCFTHLNGITATI